MRKLYIFVPLMILLPAFYPLHFHFAPGSANAIVGPILLEGGGWNSWDGGILGPASHPLGFCDWWNW